MITGHNKTIDLIRAGILTAVILITGCAGKTANPVQTYKVEDSSMSCPEIKAEFSYIDNQVATLIPESEKTGTNVALGVTGFFLIVPWFFMDLSDAEQVEIKAYKERYTKLEKIYVRKGCHEGSVGEENQLISSESAKQYGEKSTIEGRLSVLSELKEKGFITEKEYTEKKAKILSDL